MSTSSVVPGPKEATCAAKAASSGPGTTLLVDTYDVLVGVERAEHAARAAGGELGAVRLDSGDLVAQAFAVRSLLDELGAESTKIVATSNLDEHRIAALAQTPADVFGVGTSLVTGSGHPTAEFVYKLVARADERGVVLPVEKTSAGKRTRGGQKTAGRVIDGGRASEELVVALDRPEAARALAEVGARPLQVPLIIQGEVVGERTDPQALTAAVEHHRRSLAELPDGARLLSDGGAAIPTQHVAPTRQVAGS